MSFALDITATQWINNLSGHIHAFDILMTWSSKIGIEVLVFLTAIQWWNSKNRDKNRHTLLSAGFSFLLALLINQVILLFIQRARPYDAGVSHLIVPPSTDFSFPSDHATASFAIATSFLLSRAPARGTFFLLAALLITFSRVYIGTHYLTDVLGGALTGMVGALLINRFYLEKSVLNQTLTKIW